MSFSISISGHAGNGMESNSEAEIEAVRAVMRDVRQSFADHGLNLGYMNVSPPQWIEPSEAI